MPEKLDVKQGTLALMILRTLDVLGPLHGYGIARRIEETSRNRLALNYGTLYPALLKLEQEGAIAGEWGPSEECSTDSTLTGTTVFGRFTMAGLLNVEPPNARE